MKVKLWGTRGSIASAGPDTVRYGGDTACVEVTDAEGRQLILDAGSGIRPLGASTGEFHRADVLLTHLHMDHVQGLPFYWPLLDPEAEVHLWGPVSTTKSLRERLAKYLSPPLFPVRVRDLAKVYFHDVVPGQFNIGSIQITADLICHPGSTLGYRLEEAGSVLAYIPDHEPALGGTRFPGDPAWTSGFELAEDAGVLIHDSQYTDEEYDARVGWGHTSFSQLVDFARMTRARRLVTFHHDPSHTDSMLDEAHERLPAHGFELVPGTAGLTIDV